MRKRCIKHLLNKCVRYFSKQNVRIFCIFVCILSLTICLFLFVKIESRSLSLNDILDECMLDDTPCLPDINESLNRYFRKIKDQYSMLLTYHPVIDCEHGRYLLLNDFLSSHVYHGTGSQLMWYLGVLNIAYALNLTLIHLEWTSEHTSDETNSEREKYWKFEDWEIPYSAYKSCPKNSSIKKNIFKYDLISNQTFNSNLKGKQRFKLINQLKFLFDQFKNNLQDENSGFTFYSSRTFTTTSSLMELGVVFETRWWLQHRKQYNQKNGVWSGIPILSNSIPIDYFKYIPSNSNIKSIQCQPININNTLLIGVHIRHGDVVKRDNQGKIIWGDLYRYISSTAYTPLLISVVNSLPIIIENNYLITIYSEGTISDFIDILIGLKNGLPESRCHLSFFLNGKTSSTFNRLLRDDIIIGAYSTFSMATGILNSRQLKIGPIHNRARVHGMRNHLTLKLNSNHTSFTINKQKQLLIKQRIYYVWQQKQKQQNTSTPLWLDNYSDHYPEQFMLI